MKILEIQDLINNSKGIEVDGVTYDFEFNVTIGKSESSMFEVLSHHVGDVYVLVNGRHLLLDQNQLKNGQNSLYRKIVYTASLRIHDYMAKAPESDWVEERRIN